MRLKDVNCSLVNRGARETSLPGCIVGSLAPSSPQPGPGSKVSKVMCLEVLKVDRAS